MIVDGDRVDGSDADTINRVERGYLSFRGTSLWYLTRDNASIGIYPVPAVGATVELTYVYTPTALVLPADEPSAFPADFHQALIHYVSSFYYDEIEDNAELAERQTEKFEAMAVELQRHRNSMNGTGVFTMAVAGRTR